MQTHFLRVFVANLKNDAIYPESFCDKNLAIRKVFAFCDSGLSELGVELLPGPLPCGEEGPIGRAGLPFLKESKL